MDPAKPGDEFWHAWTWLPEGDSVAVSAAMTYEGFPKSSGSAGYMLMEIVGVTGVDGNQNGVFFDTYVLGVESPASVSGARTFDVPAAGLYLVRVRFYYVGVDSMRWSVSLGLAGGCSSGLSVLEAGCVCSPAAPRVGESQGFAADPVHTGSGNFHDSFTDIDVPGRGGGLAMSRAYNSLAAGVEGPLGFGWSFRWGTRLDLSVSGRVGLVQPSGAQAWWWGTGDGPFAAPQRVSATLSHSGSGFEVALADGTVWGFDDGGRLVWERDRNGYETTLSYTDGRLVSVSEDLRAGGRTLSFGWSGPRVTSVTDPANRVVSYGYGPAGDLESVTDVAGGVWHYTYDGAHRLTGVRSPLQSATGGPGVVNHYDAAGRVDVQTDALGRSTLFDYASVPGGTKVTDPSGDVRVDFYDSLGRRWKVTGGYGTPGALTWRFSFDASLGVASVVVEGLERTVLARTFDGDGNVTSVSDALSHTTTFDGFNPFGQPGEVIDPAGVATTYSYDSAGNVVSVCTPRADNPPAAGTVLGCGDVAAGDRRTVGVVYGDPNRPGEATAMVDPRGYTWWLGSDGFGSRDRVTDPEGNVTTFGFDGVGRPLWRVSARGNAAGANPDDYRTVFGTDAFGRVTSTTDPLGHTTASGFDADGRLDWSRDAETHLTDFEYDAAGQLRFVHRPDGTTVGTEYTPDGLVWRQVDAAGAVTTYTYDALDRPETVKDPKNPTVAYGYDTAGELWWRQEPGGDCGATPGQACTRFSYDAAGRVTGIDYSDATPDVGAIGYDPVGRRTSMSDATGTSTWSWDTLGQLRASTSSGETVGYGWDLAGNLTALTYPGAGTVTRSFDDASRLVAVTDWQGRTFSFQPDAEGNVERIDYPAGTANRDVFGYNRAGELTSIGYQHGSATTASLTYGRTPDGLVDDITTTGLPDPGTLDVGYDLNNRLTTVGPATYSYDPADNLTGLLGGTRQVFDSANQLCFTAPVGVSGGTCTTTPAGGTDLDHDNRGNRTKVTPPASGDLQSVYTYDLADRLTSASVPTAEGNTGDYTSVTPTRIVDTRTGQGAPLGTVAPGQTITVAIAGQGGIPTTGAAAAVLNVTATDAAGAGHLTVWPSDGTLPATSNVNFTAAQPISNLAVVKVGADGKVKITNGGSAAVHVIVDTQGWYATATGAPGGTFTPVNPKRVADTRTGLNVTQAQVPAGGTLTVQITGKASIPTTNVASATLNVTVANNPAGGWLVAYPSDTAMPATSNVNFAAGRTLAELAVVKVGADGRIKITNGSPAPVDVIVDAFGWTSTSEVRTANTFTPLAPARAYDTRPPPLGTCTTGCGPVPTGQVREITLTGTAGLPDGGVAAVSLNLTVTGATGAGWVALWPANAAQPNPITSNVNYTTGQTVANAAIVKLSPDGKLKLLVGGAATDVIIDINGYYSAATHTWTYTYNGDGLRTAKTGPAPDPAHTGQTTFTWAHHDALPQPLGQHATRTNSQPADTTWWIYGPGGVPVEQINPDGTTWNLHHDHLGSTRALTDTTGATIATTTYDPYGNPTHTTGTATTPLGYTSQYTDAETGLQYLRARFYDPTTGQFLSRDPINAITRSPYGYVYGNPLNATDPSGLYCLSGVAGHDANGGEICNGAGEVAHNAVNATVVTVTHGQADCVMGLTCNEGAQSVVSSATGGAACSRFMDAGCTEPLAEARAQICPTFGCVAVTWDGHNFHHHEALGVAADLSIGLGPVSSCEPHESFWASAFVASLGVDHDQGGWSPTGSAGFSPLRFGGGVVHWFN